MCSLHYRSSRQCRGASTQAVLESQEGEQGRVSGEVKRLRQQLDDAQREHERRAQSSATVISNLEAKLVRAREVAVHDGVLR